MKRPDRVHGYLVRDGARIAIRSSTIAAQLQANESTIEQLREALVKANEESGRLEAELSALRSHRWVRIGRWLRIVRA